MWLISGYNPDEFDNARMSVYMSHFPSGTSMQNVEHWAQSVRNFDGARSDFSHYDFGESQNMEIYGSKVPPIFNITQFPSHTTDLVIFSGGDDDLADPEDVHRMVGDLPGEPLWTFLQPYDHLDFVWGEFVNRDVYTPMVVHMDMKRERLGVVETRTETNSSSVGVQDNDAGSSGTKDSIFSGSSAQIIVAAACVGGVLAVVGSVVSVVQKRRRRDRIQPAVRAELLTKLRSNV